VAKLPLEGTNKNLLTLSNYIIYLGFYIIKYLLYI